MKLVIDRSKWLHGEGLSDLGESTSFLFRVTDGKMCCLGFACLATGLTVSEIVGCPTPASVERDKQPSWYRPGTDFHSIYVMNDQRGDDVRREQEIINRLALIGFEVEFTGAY